MQQDVVMSERIKVAEQVIAADMRDRYPAFAGKTRIPRPALVAEALAYALRQPPTADRLATYLEQFGADRANVKGNRGGSFLTNSAIAANAERLHVVLLGLVAVGSRDWQTLYNHFGGANQRAVYYVALRTMADGVGEGKT